MEQKVSFSQYYMWKTCPWQWKLNYVDGIRDRGQTIHTIFGDVIHRTIQEWLDILYNGSTTRAKTIYLHDGFKEKLLEAFSKGIEKDESGNSIYPSDKPTLLEFYDQGCKILTYVQDNYKKLFPTENVKLYGIEHELNVKVRPHIIFRGFIDIVTHNTDSGEYTLYDLKTSSKGWSSYTKNDFAKVSQLLLYKKFFAQTHDIPEHDIQVEYVIMKRMLIEGGQFISPRITKYPPPNGPRKMKQAWAEFEEFLDAAFNEDGSYNANQIATPSKSTCKFCPFRERKDLCEHGV